jgi:hypothetical protein
VSAPPTKAAENQPVFSSRSVAWMLGVGVVAFLALVALATFQPELRDGQDGGKHALSRSAVGFHGLTRLLKDTGVPVVVSRGAIPRVDGPPGLVIQTPEVGTDMTKPRTDDRRRARLVVLDKWFATPDPRRPGWVLKGRLRPPEGPAQLGVERARDGKSKVGRVHRRAGSSRPVVTATANGRRYTLDPIDRLQTLDGLGGEAVVRDEEGRTVLWRLADNTFVLTDPDLLNNQGLKSARNATYAYGLIDQLRGGGPVIFDVTLNGFSRSRSLLRLALAPPFLGAVLCALAAALLMGFHAAVRFGPVPAPERALALGKRVLVDNSALLIRLARREHRMGGRYAALIRRATIKGLALGRETDAAAADAALDRLTGAGEPAFSALVAEAEQARTEDQLMRAARALHRRKLEMTRERI